MANPEHLEKLKKMNWQQWNAWREENASIIPDLSGSDSTGDLTGFNLSNAILSRADLSEVKLISVNFSNADLSNADLSDTDLTDSDLRNANLSKADLRNTNLLRTELSGADLSESHFDNNILGDIDLSEVKGLDIIHHFGPSTIGIDSLYLSKGKIPDAFLRGCGVPEDLITYLPALVGAAQVIQYYSCFISYSTKNEEFAKRLHSKMREAQLRVWFAPEDMKGGKKLYDQIDNAIQMHDRLLLVLSEHSMKSEWVTTKIKRALRAEKKEGRRKLFPIRLVDYAVIQEWEKFDADMGKDLAAEIRSYHIPDFSNWKNHDSFEAAFANLLRDLKAEEM